MKVNVPALELLNEALLNVILSIPTLSLATAVKITVCFLSEDLSSIAFPVALLVSELIVGSWLSALLILIVTLSVEVLPAASDTVNVRLSVLEPKL